MVAIEDFGTYDTAWCPGCGNHSILKAVKQALAGLGLAPHEVLWVTGIGQAAKIPHYFNCNFFNGLHGRSLPAALGARLANPDIPIFVESGDGCSYGEGGGHFLAALRRNPRMTMLVHDNQIYGLTKGQASPTTGQGQKTKAQPHGAPSAPLKPLAMGVVMDIAFVGRAFSGDVAHLAEMIALAHKAATGQDGSSGGLALLDILHPCVSFNKVNTFAWYKERCYKVGAEHDTRDVSQAMVKAMEFGDRIPLGVLYRGGRSPFENGVPGLSAGPMARRSVDLERLSASQPRF